MKLEVGMYVRGKYYGYRGKIGKIIKNYNNDLEIAYTKMKENVTPKFTENLSKNIEKISDGKYKKVKINDMEVKNTSIDNIVARLYKDYKI